MRIDVAIAHDNNPKAIIARVRGADGAGALEAAVADLADDAEVAVRVVDDSDGDTPLALREEPSEAVKPGKLPPGVGPWEYMTAGELEKLKPATLLAAAAKKAKR